jgi:ribosomal protein S12 methylthiotransferase
LKTRTTKINKVNVITLGCSKNTYDSEVLLKQLEANKLIVYHNNKKLLSTSVSRAQTSEANIVIINTCGFIDNAKQESIDTILEYAKKKQDGEIDKLIVTGCLSERYKPELQKEIPDVDEYFGTHDLPYLLKTLNADYKHELIGERVLTTPKHFAYFKISEGCDRPCSFCAIPIMRGKHVSTPIESLVKQAKNLAEDGVKELILIAQDLTYFGLDINGTRTLSELLRKLSDVNGIEWIRLHYAFPQGFPTDVLDVMRERKNICNYLDIPIQHISDRILSSMKRGTTKIRTNDLIKMIRDKVPEVAIRTTLITGYPGETQAEFLELKDWAEEQKFERLGVFTYSHEENTSAYELEDNIPTRTK